MDTAETPSARRRAARVVVGVVLALLAALAVVPLLWPVPELEDTVEPAALAGPDSRFVEIEGIEYHYVRSGEATCAVILLHGAGAWTFSWKPVLDDIAQRCTVVAYDRPAFGLTGRPLSWSGPNPYDPATQADHTIALMDALDIERAVLVGHSAGGAVATLAAERHPERVIGLVLEAPAVFVSGGPPALLRPLLRTPQAKRIGPLFLRRVLDGDTGERAVRGAWADPQAVPDEVIAGYQVPLRARDWDRALWEWTAAPRSADPADAVTGIRVPTLVVAGDRDTYVPYEQSAQVAEALGAPLKTFEGTGHIPHEERPERFASVLYRFLDDLEESGVL